MTAMRRYISGSVQPRRKSAPPAGTDFIRLALESDLWLQHSFLLYARLGGKQLAARHDRVRDGPRAPQAANVRVAA